MGGGGERSCRDNYNDREHKADEAGRGGGGDKAERVNSENSRGTQTRSKECARARDAFFFFFNVSLYVSGQRPRFISTFIYFELAAHRF